jgi:hypothetical protein
MRLVTGIVAASLLTVAGLAYAEEPFQPQVTLQELGQQCANSIGRYHVELQVAAIQATKYQAEIARLKAEAAKAKEPEKK